MPRMKGPLVALLVALLLWGGARTLGAHANQTRAGWPRTSDLPFAPSAAAAPYVTLGYRELAADLLWIRLVGYVGGDDDRAGGSRALIEAIVALDPTFEKAYGFIGVAMSGINTQPSTDDLLAAIRLLEAGMKRFPLNYKLPQVAGHIYTGEMETDDPELRKQWDLAGVRMFDRAASVPGAPKTVATAAAHLRTKHGQREKAIENLRELIVYTTDPGDRQILIDKLAALAESNAADIDYELEIEARRFERAWQATRPELPPTQYLLVGPPLSPSFRLEDLAVDRDLIGSEELIEPLPPLED